MYKEMKRDFLTWWEQQDHKSPIVANYAITKALRLMQIASGFVKDEKGNTLPLDKNPKDAVLLELIESILPNKLIIWASFIFNYNSIAKLLEKSNIAFTLLTGQQSSKEKREAISMFQNSKDTNIIISTQKAGGTGINLTAASYSIIYSRDFSLADSLQAQARNYGVGSERHTKVTQIDLVTKDTIDEHIIKRLGSKELMAKDIINLV